MDEQEIRRGGEGRPQTTKRVGEQKNMKKKKNKKDRRSTIKTQIGYPPFLRKILHHPLESPAKRLKDAIENSSWPWLVAGGCIRAWALKGEDFHVIWEIEAGV